MKLLDRIKLLLGSLKGASAYRPKEQILLDLMALNSEDLQYGVRTRALFEECSLWLAKDHDELKRLMKHPCRLNRKFSDKDILEMANVVDTMRLAAILVVASALDSVLDNYVMDMSMAQINYQADFLRYIGYEECDLPDVFKWKSSDVAKEVVSAWKSEGMTRQEMCEKVVNGFDDLVWMIKRSVASKYGILKTKDDLFWRYVPDTIARVAKRLFREGHFSEAVEAACKELNDVVKKEFFKRTGKECDGVSLMRNAFGHEQCVISLSNAENAETRKSEQQGYMEMFAGVMSALRNPKAHANLPLEKIDAVRQLMLVGMLMDRFEGNVKPCSADVTGARVEGLLSV